MQSNNYQVFLQKLQQLQVKQYSLETDLKQKLLKFYDQYIFIRCRNVENMPFQHTLYSQIMNTIKQSHTLYNKRKYRKMTFKIEETNVVGNLQTLKWYEQHQIVDEMLQMDLQKVLDLMKEKQIEFEDLVLKLEQANVINDAIEYFNSN
ncbi:hypothetical protein OXYTRIMIC_774 [Oxytricha trifallax]|uniref:Uncharacterized protein n=1 Tax=Oxytricha trifallax TaxID=1172189 RepID=A0A073HY64_9SPIT|nr:hypothetical protein OXYTRIMIC_774 [Oxytricha trifallax]